MSIIAIIPARGGSKGIPRKNVIDLCGKPLVQWSIEQAKASELVGRVIVATDDAEIRDVASRCGAEVFARSNSSASDDAPTEQVLLEVDAHVERCGETPELYVLLQPTSPIRQPGDISNAIMTLRKREASSLFSAREIEGYTWNELEGRYPTANYWDRERRQDQRERRLEENGSIYVYEPAVLRVQRSRLGGDAAVYCMHPLDSFQIDTPEDVTMMRQLMAIRMEGVGALS